MLRERNLDFADFDSIAANLYLSVFASQKFQSPIGPLTGKVSSPVHDSGRELFSSTWLGNESLGSEFGTPDVSTGGSDTAEEQLSRFAVGNFVA